jgi:hypothetical protein
VVRIHSGAFRLNRTRTVTYGAGFACSAPGWTHSTSSIRSQGPSRKPATRRLFRPIYPADPPRHVLTLALRLQPMIYIIDILQGGVDER